MNLYIIITTAYIKVVRNTIKTNIPIDTNTKYTVSNVIFNNSVIVEAIYEENGKLEALYNILRHIL